MKSRAITRTGKYVAEKVMIDEKIRGTKIK